MTVSALSKTDRPSSRWRAWASEPLLQFLAIGLLLWLASVAYQRSTDVRQIVVTPQRVAQLATRHALQFGSAPDQRMLEALVERDTRDEILFREGLALGVDKDDEVIRRRVIQKVEFITQDLNPPAEPTHAQLQAYFAAHKERYAPAARVSFTHIFFSGDKGGSVVARERASRALEELTSKTLRAPERGDPFPDLYDYSLQDADQVTRLFGNTPIAGALLEEPAGRWFGPVQSAYGWHLARIAERPVPQPPVWEEVRDRVRTEYLLDAQKKANADAFERLARQYTVVRRGARK